MDFNSNICEGRGLEYSIYEASYHTTHTHTHLSKDAKKDLTFRFSDKTSVKG